MSTPRISIVRPSLARSYAQSQRLVDEEKARCGPKFAAAAREAATLERAAVMAAGRGDLREQYSLMGDQIALMEGVLEDLPECLG